MLYRYFVLALFLITPMAQALVWKHAIKAENNKEPSGPIEFEIASDESFASKSLVDQGFSKTPILSGNLAPGLYYLRYRLAPTSSEPGEWSRTVELLLTTKTETRVIEPINGAQIESPTTRTSVFNRWSRVDGATQYQVEVRRLGEKQSQTFKSKNPFLTTELSYGTWIIQVHVFFGTKRVSSSSPLRFSIEPITQAGAEFIKPKNDDVIPAYKKTSLLIKRLYQPTHTTLVINQIENQPNLPNEKKIIEVSPRTNKIDIPALKPGKFQISILDRLNNQSTVESNIVIQSEADPMQYKTQGTESTAEANIGPLFGEHFQTNHRIGFNKLRKDRDGIRIGTILRNEYYEPYHLEFRGEAIDTKFHLYNQLNYYADSDWEYLFSLNTLYRLPATPKPNSIFVRGGLFVKRYRQITQDLTMSSADFTEAQTSPIMLYGLITGIDWTWKTWSRKWDSRVSARLMLPLISTSKVIATGAVSPLPATEISATFNRRISNFFYLTVSPELKYEWWLISEKDDAKPDSKHYQLSYGLQLGLGLDL
jgi:hypothetical protein